MTPRGWYNEKWLKREWSEIMSFLKDHWITENLWGNFQSCLYKNMGKLMEDWFWELLSNYQNQIFNVWPVINTVMSSTLVTYDLLWHDMPPLAVVRRRIELMKDKIKIGDKAAYKYMELLARYEMVERELSLWSMDVDEIMPNWTNAWIIGDGTDVMEDASDGTDVMEDAQI